MASTAILALLITACCLVDVVWGAFTTVNTTVSGELLNQEIYHVFNNSNQLSLCVVIPDDNRDVVIQPGSELGVPRTGGEFRVEVGGGEDQFEDAFSVTTRSCKVQCPVPLGNFSTCSPASSGCCFEPSGNNGTRPDCDQLVFKPVLVGTRSNDTVNRESLIQYVPQGMSESPVNVTLRLSFPGIYINGDGSPIVVVDGTPLTLDFTLWQLPPISQAVRACEILANGSRVSSNKLLIRIGLRNDDTCYNPFADTLGPAVSIVRAYLNPGSLIPGSTSRVFLSQGTCADVMVDSDVITIFTPFTATTDLSPTTTEASPSTILPPIIESAQGLSRSNVVVILVSAISGIFVMIMIMLVIGIATLCYHKKQKLGPLAHTTGGRTVWCVKDLTEMNTDFNSPSLSPGEHNVSRVKDLTEMDTNFNSPSLSPGEHNVSRVKDLTEMDTNFNSPSLSPGGHNVSCVKDLIEMNTNSSLSLGPGLEYDRFQHIRRGQPRDYATSSTEEITEVAHDSVVGIPSNLITSASIREAQAHSISTDDKVNNEVSKISMQFADKKMPKIRMYAKGKIHRHNRQVRPPKTETCDDGEQLQTTGADTTAESQSRKLAKDFFSSNSDRYPGIVFSKLSASLSITSSGVVMDRLHDMGIYISVSEDSLSSAEETMDLHVRPCFCGPFRLPSKYRSACPAYLICHNREASFKKDITIRIHHCASLESEEHAKNMAFLSASSTPQYERSGDESRPVYTFKEVDTVCATFRPGGRVCEISLRHFCLVTVGTGNDLLYSARLYRNIRMDPSPWTALFCVCLGSPVYMDHCDTVIPHRYPGFSLEGLSEASGVIEGDEVMMHATDKAGSVYSVTFDKTPALILKRDILLPETTKRSVSEFANYPPRVLICVQQTQVSSCVESSPEVKILGLDREWTFPLLLGQAVRRTAVPNDASPPELLAQSLPLPQQPEPAQLPADTTRSHSLPSQRQPQLPVPPNVSTVTTVHPMPAGSESGPQCSWQYQRPASGDSGFYSLRVNLEQHQLETDGVVHQSSGDSHQSPPNSERPLPSASVELKTLQECTTQLETALGWLERDLVHFLNREGFISDSIHDSVLKSPSMLDEAEKAGELVKWIKRRVKQDYTSYHKLVAKLKEFGNVYGPVLRALEAEHSKQQGVLGDPYVQPDGYEGPLASYSEATGSYRDIHHWDSHMPHPNYQTLVSGYQSPLMEPTYHEGAQMDYNGPPSTYQLPQTGSSSEGSPVDQLTQTDFQWLPEFRETFDYQWGFQGPPGQEGYFQNELQGASYGTVHS